MKPTWVSDGFIKLSDGKPVIDALVAIRVHRFGAIKSEAGVLIPYSGPLMLFPIWKWWTVLRGKCGLL